MCALSSSHELSQPRLRPLQPGANLTIVTAVLRPPLNEQLQTDFGRVGGVAELLDLFCECMVHLDYLKEGEGEIGRECREGRRKRRREGRREGREKERRGREGGEGEKEGEEKVRAETEREDGRRAEKGTEGGMGCESELS